VSAFSLTCYLAQHSAVKFVKDFFGIKDMKKARQRLDRLRQELVATTTAASQIHEIVHGDTEIMKKSMGGKQRHLACNSPSIEYPSL
jgi:hypothetical protein